MGTVLLTVQSCLTPPIIIHAPVLWRYMCVIPPFFANLADLVVSSSRQLQT